MVTYDAWEKASGDVEETENVSSCRKYHRD